MRTISLHQFYASAVSLGLKRHETRHWPTRYRGPLAIHAAQKPVYGEDVPLHIRNAFSARGTNLPRAGKIKDEPFTGLPFGRIVCVVWLEDCIPVEKIRDRLKREDFNDWSLGNYNDGRFAWKLDLLHVFAEKLPTTGRQRFWNWDYPPALEGIVGPKIASRRAHCHVGT